MTIHHENLRNTNEIVIGLTMTLGEKIYKYKCIAPILPNCFKDEILNNQNVYRLDADQYIHKG